jgi:hypothetical protein
MHDSSDGSGSIRALGRRLLRHLTFLGVLMASLSGQPPSAIAAECGEWTLVDGEADVVPAYADTHAQYWVWSFTRTSQSLTTAFRLRGEFPYARYMSFQTYSATQGNALQDFHIVPDAGSINPFQPGMDREAVPRAYTVWFVPPTSGREQNRLEMPSDTLWPNLVLRILRADQAKPGGGVPPPTIEAFDDRTGQPVSCPPRGLPVGLFTEPRDMSQLPSPEDPISFYRVSGAGAIPNAVSGYLVAQLADADEGTLAVLRFRLPSFPDTFHQPGTPLTGREEVRYMGLCVHGRISTLTSECGSDDELQPRQDSQGFVTVVVGPENSAVRATAQARGYHYLSWQALAKPLLIYRQILPQAEFSGSVERVPVYDSEVDRDVQRAERFIGAYAPTGVVCQVSTFLANASACALP